jgi:hypothetical protein
MEGEMPKWEKTLWIIGGTLLSGIIMIQFIPIWEFVPKFDPRNPPVRHEIQWASPEADRLMRMVCYTCHSNETTYPIYAQIAPVSWIAAEHVNEGRAQLNFSEQPPQTINAEQLIAYIESDAMPPEAYRLTHPEANLTAAQKAALIAGIRATFEKYNGEFLNNPVGEIPLS